MSRTIKYRARRHTLRKRVRQARKLERQSRMKYRIGRAAWQRLELQRDQKRFRKQVSSMLASARGAHGSSGSATSFHRKASLRQRAKR